YPAAGNDFLARLLHASGGVHGVAGPTRARAGAARVRFTAELLVRGGVRLSDVPDLSNYGAPVRIRGRVSLGASARRAGAGRAPRRSGGAAQLHAVAPHGVGALALVAFAVAESGDACCRGRVPQLHDPGDAGLWRALRLRRGRGVPVHAGMPGALPTNCTRS